MDCHISGKCFEGFVYRVTALISERYAHCTPRITVTAVALRVCFHSGNYSGRLGRHHVLCHGCAFLLQLHLLHLPHYSMYSDTHMRTYA